MEEGKPMDTDSRVQLAEMRGDIKLILANQARTTQDHLALTERVHSHSNRFQLIENRFQGIEAKLILEEGLKKGIATSIRTMYMACGVLSGGSLIGIVAFILRSRGI